MDRLRAMEFFLSISRTESFSETARTFGVSATSVSRMITEFESELNVKLLLRSTRQVVLTEAGQEYARHLEGILWSISEAQSNITAISAAPMGMLRVHSRMMFGLGVLPPLITKFRRQYPDIHVELILGESKADLRRQQIDIDFRIAPPVEAGLKRRILFKSERYLVASPGYLAARTPPETPDQIATHECLAYTLPGDNYIWRFKQEEAVAEVAVNPRHVSNNGVALLEFARLGEGIALLEDYTVHHDIASGRLVRLMPQYQVSNTSFDDGMYATILDTPMIPAKIRLFLDFIAAHVSGKALRFSAYGDALAL